MKYNGYTKCLNKPRSSDIYAETHIKLILGEGVNLEV